MVSNGDNGLEEKLQEWLIWDKNEITRKEVADLEAHGKKETLSKLLLSRMEFGTAGLRGCMGPGYSQMNDLVIIQTTQGLASYIVSTNENAKTNGVVIGFDGRNNSKRFAELATRAFLNEGIPVYLYSQICPTPFVPFAVSTFKCVAGVMVTASHNPKEDNGYKVYWNNGAQIISPHDKNIQSSILQNLCPRDGAWEISNLRENTLVKDPLAVVMDKYYEELKKGVLDLNANEACPVKMAYTAMHGVGHRYMVEAFKVTQFKEFISVLEQQDPDPDFPTVTFPNPEEGKSALDLALKTANNNNCTIILANDPDADRLAVAEKNEEDQWHVFSGNELGALLGWWALYCYRARNPDADLSNVYMLASTVSSKILQSMARKEGFKFKETLTGFKWMGNEAFLLEGQGSVVLFAYEEAIGFMCGTAVLDKDGISASVRIAELVTYLANKGLTLRQHLEDIYSEYGHHISLNSYYLCYEPPVIQKLFDKLRTFNNTPDTYPSCLLGGKYKIIGVRDLTTGLDTDEDDGRAKLPVSRSSQMVTFKFDNGLVATLRTSGTEPKIKYYTELCAPPDQKDKEALHQVLTEMVDAIVEEFLQPSVNGLTPRKA